MAFQPYNLTQEINFNPEALTLREKCLNAELFLVLISLYSDWIQENTDQN